MAKYNFKGWDWTELADYFGVEAPSISKIFGPGGGKYEEDEWKPLQDFLMDEAYISNVPGFPIRYRPEVIDACRAFLKKLAKVDSGYSSPLWYGLLKIKHEQTFMGYFIELLPNMWS